MSANDLMCFDAFAEGLFLSYLAKHAIWGGPAPIPSSDRRWTPNPTNILITKAACPRFRETAERLAYAVPLEKKLGGVTFAGKVRELYEATLDQASKPSGKESSVPAERAWDFTVGRSQKRVVLDILPQREIAATPITEHPAIQRAFPFRTFPDRRRFLSLAVASPVAVMPTTTRATPFEPQISSPNNESLSEQRRVLTSRLVEDAANAANSLIQLLADPASGFRLTGKTAPMGSSIYEIDENAFLSAYELANILAATIDHETCKPREFADCRRYIARAEKNKYIRYHSSLAKMLVRSISDHHKSGTNWFGPYAPTPSTHSNLVTCAISDLENHRNAINGREDLINAAGDPFTFENEAQLVLGPLLFRQERHDRPHGNILRNWTILLGQTWVGKAVKCPSQCQPSLTHIWPIRAFNPSREKQTNQVLAP